jgi:hypothetical protein
MQSSSQTLPATMVSGVVSTENTFSQANLSNMLSDQNALSLMYVCPKMSGLGRKWRMLYRTLKSAMIQFS